MSSVARCWGRPCICCIQNCTAALAASGADGACDVAGVRDDDDDVAQGRSLNGLEVPGSILEVRCSSSAPLLGLESSSVGLPQKQCSPGGGHVEARCSWCRTR